VRVFAADIKDLTPPETEFPHRACDGGFLFVAEPLAVPYVQGNFQSFSWMILLEIDELNAPSSWHSRTCWIE